MPRRAFGLEPMRAIPLVLLFLLPASAEDATSTAEARDKAISAAMKHLDDAVWKLSTGGSPRREYTLAITGWAYLLAADKSPKARRFPSRKQQTARIHGELVRYVERVAALYEKDAKKKRQPKPPRTLLEGFRRARTPQYVWPLSVAAHYFAESAARGKRKGECKKMLKLIVRILSAAQQEDGGWGHDDAGRPGMGLPAIRIPKPDGGQFEYPATLLSATNCALGALGTAHRALKTKRSLTAKKGRAYLVSAQNRDGTFPYDPSQKNKLQGGMPPTVGRTTLARTAGAVYALLLAGAKQNEEAVTRGIAAIDKNPELMSDGHGSATMALQYGALLANARGERAWRVFRRIFFPRILEAQETSGAFTCIADPKLPGVTVDAREFPGITAGSRWTAGGKTYVTAIHTLILLLDRANSRIAPNAPAPQGPVTGGKR